jgi:hypothetical protein
MTHCVEPGAGLERSSRTLIAMLIGCALLAISCEQRDTSSLRTAIRGQWRSSNTALLANVPGRFDDTPNGRQWVTPPPKRVPQPDLDGALYYFGETLLTLVESDGRTIEKPWRVVSFNDRTRELVFANGPRRDDVYRVVLAPDCMTAKMYWDDPKNNSSSVNVEWDLTYVDRHESPAKN